jgi:hypothetical protein
MTKRLSDELGIRSTTRTVRTVVCVPKGGLARTRVVTKKVSLPALSCLEDPVEDLPPSAGRRRR